MVPRPNTHIVAQGLAWLTWQFQQPNCRAWLAVLLQPWQDLENATWQVLTMRFLSTAILNTPPQTNPILDTIGALVGQGRNGMSDHDYQSLIYLRISANRATGCVTDWSNFGRILLRTSSGPIGYVGDQSGTLFSVSGLSLNGSVVGQTLSGAIPNGQHGVFSYTTWADGSDLAFGSVYDTTAGQQGFGSVYDSTAGGNVAAGVQL